LKFHKLTPAVAAVALAVSGTVAQAQSSSVTLYGVVDMGLNYQTITPGSNFSGESGRSQFGVASGQQSGSRWGIRGVEQLNSDVSVNFVYESAVNIANGESNGFTRQSTLGLVSKTYGSVDLGRRTTPTTYALAGIDPFGQSFGTASLDTSMGTSFMRLSNMVMYTSPNFSGVTGSVGYSFDIGTDQVYGTGDAESFGNSNKNRAVSAALRYANGPVTAAFGYDQVMPANVPGQASANVKAWILGGTYDFKVVKLHAAYGQTIDGIIEGSDTLNNANLSGGDTNTQGGVLFAPGARTNSWMVGASAPVGAATSVFGSVQQLLPGGDFKNLASTSTQTAASVGATYSFSKRTNVYAYYSYVNNVAMLEGATANTVGLGIRHFF
jgi:predicted porin